MEQGIESNENVNSSKNSSFQPRNIAAHILLVLTYFSLGLILSPKLLPGIQSVSKKLIAPTRNQAITKPYQITSKELYSPTATPPLVQCHETYGSDGKNIYLDTCETRLILVKEINTSKWQPELLNNAVDVSLAPNSENVAISSRFGGEEKGENVLLYGSNLAGDLITINHVPFSEGYNLIWSPSGRYLAYSIQPQVGPAHLAVFDFIKEKNVKLYDKNITADFYNYDESSVVWSPNEKSISANLSIKKPNASLPEGEEIVFYNQSVVMLMN